MAARLETAAEHGSARGRAGSASVESSRLPRAPGTVAVALADDRAHARRALRAIIHARAGLRVLGECDEHLESIPMVGGVPPDVLVLELRSPGPESIAAIRSLTERAPSVAIVVLTGESSPAFARQALDAGALGYVMADTAERELPDAVSRAAVGDEFVSPRIASELSAVRATAEDGLTAREAEVLQLTALGFTGTEVARQLRLSRRTVESHRATIHRKLGSASRAELVGYALRRGLVKT